MHCHDRQGSNAHTKEERGEWVPAHTARRGTPGVLRLFATAEDACCALRSYSPNLFRSPGDSRSQTLGLPGDGPNDAARRPLPAVLSFRGTALIHSICHVKPPFGQIQNATHRSQYFNCNSYAGRRRHRPWRATPGERREKSRPSAIKKACPPRPKDGADWNQALKNEYPIVAGACDSGHPLVLEVCVFTRHLALKLLAPTVLVSLLLVAACASGALYLSHLHVDMSGVLSEHIDSTLAAWNLQTAVAELLKSLRGGHDDPAAVTRQLIEFNWNRAAPAAEGRDLANLEREQC